MKANTENIKQALKLCAEAHHSEYEDWVEDAQFGIQSEVLPVMADVKLIAKAFFGTDSVVDVGWGYTNVYLDLVEFRNEVDKMLLGLALPDGWINKIK